MHKAPAYVTISAVFLMIIGIGFVYSYFFYPDVHPIPCLVKAYTGKDCPSCGFSRSFSYYTHGRFAQGRSFNPLSWAVFLFFAAQALVRFYIVIKYYKNRRSFSRIFIASDTIISILLFLLAFLPVILKT